MSHLVLHIVELQAIIFVYFVLGWYCLVFTSMAAFWGSSSIDRLILCAIWMFLAGSFPSSICMVVYEWSWKVWLHWSVIGTLASPLVYVGIILLSIVLWFVVVQPIAWTVERLTNLCDHVGCYRKSVGWSSYISNTGRQTSGKFCPKHRDAILKLCEGDGDPSWEKLPGYATFEQQQDRF